MALQLIYLMFAKLLGWVVWGSRTGYTPLTRGDRRRRAVGMIARSGAVRTDHGVGLRRPHPRRCVSGGVRYLMSLAGLPATTAYGSTSLRTTDPPPTTAWAPILTGPATITLVASQAPSPS